MIFSKKNEHELGSDASETTPAGNALDLLKKDHRTVSALFKQFEGAEAEDEKVALAQQICVELTIHAEVEERLFYPAARAALDDKAENLVDEAAVEHRSLKALIAEMDGSSAGDRLFDANVKVLKEYVEHHVKEEEREMFPKLEDEKIDLDGLGAKMAELKSELQAKIGEAKHPRNGAKPSVHVPVLHGGNGAHSKAKSSTSKSKNGHTRSTSHSAHR